MVAVTQSANEGRTQAITTRSQTQPALPTLLGRQAPRIPVGGRIRAGIKVLTKKAEALRLLLFAGVRPGMFRAGFAPCWFVNDGRHNTGMAWEQ